MICSEGASMSSAASSPLTSADFSSSAAGCCTGASPGSWMRDTSSSMSSPSLSSATAPSLFSARARSACVSSCTPLSSTSTSSARSSTTSPSPSSGALAAAGEEEASGFSEGTAFSAAACFSAGAAAWGRNREASQLPPFFSRGACCSSSRISEAAFSFSSEAGASVPEACPGTALPFSAAGATLRGASPLSTALRCMRALPAWAPARTAASVMC